MGTESSLCFLLKRGVRMLKDLSIAIQKATVEAARVPLQTAPKSKAEFKKQRDGFSRKKAREDL